MNLDDKDIHSIIKLMGETNIHSIDDLLGNEIVIDYLDNEKETFSQRVFEILGIINGFISLAEKNEIVEKINIEKEKLKFKEKLESYTDVLKESNIFFENGIWYFGDAKGQQVWRKYFRSFPSAGFNKKNELGNNKGLIENISDLKELFEFLGFTIATEEEEKLRWKGIIEGYGYILRRESNIFFENGIWYFGDAKGPDSWRKYFRSFPNSTFNRDNGLGTKEGKKIGFIETIPQLKELFDFFKLRLATEEEEILRWKGIIESYSDKLRDESNIILVNGIWDFSKAKGLQNWRKYFRNFPNATFNKVKGLGNKDGKIESLGDLEKLFKFFGKYK